MANYYAAATDAQGRLTAPSVLSQIDARTKATMRADLPALAEDLEIGGGMPEGGKPGQILTTGTDGKAAWQAPATPSTGPTVVETATFTVPAKGGEFIAGRDTVLTLPNGAKITLTPGQGAIAFPINGQWHARTVVLSPIGVYGSNPSATPVVPLAPTFTDTPNGGGTWTTPTQTGIIYTPASGTAEPGQMVTVTAASSDPTKYRIEGVYSWSHTFPVGTGPRVLLTDSFERTDFGTRADSGQVYTIRDATKPPAIAEGWVQAATTGGTEFWADAGMRDVLMTARIDISKPASQAHLLLRLDGISNRVDVTFDNLANGRMRFQSFVPTGFDGGYTAFPSTVNKADCTVQVRAQGADYVIIMDGQEIKRITHADANATASTRTQCGFWLVSGARVASFDVRSL